LEGVRKPFVARQMDDGARLPATATWWRARLKRSVVKVAALRISPANRLQGSAFGAYAFHRRPARCVSSRSAAPSNRLEEFNITRGPRVTSAALMISPAAMRRSISSLTSGGVDGAGALCAYPFRPSSAARSFA
jgi:hypothetical protein